MDNAQKKNLNQTDWHVTTHVYRAKCAGLPHTLTDEQWHATLEHFKHRCAYCLRKHFEVLEHFIPITQGGGTTAANCVPACASCNTCKDHPKLILLSDHEKANAALCRVARYLQRVGGGDFQQSVVDAYIDAQYHKIPVHHNKKGNITMSDVSKITNSPFDAIRQMKQGCEVWSARDLQYLLEYANWQNFENAIERAMVSCKVAGRNVSDHFIEVSKKVSLGSGSQREVKDYQLTRFACYSIAMNGDVEKTSIAAAQTYFMVKTREAETRQEQIAQPQQQALPLQGNDFLAGVRTLLNVPTLKELQVVERYIHATKALYPQKGGVAQTEVIKQLPSPKADKNTIEYIQAQILKHLSNHGPLTFNTLYHSYMKNRDEMTARKALDALVEQGIVEKEVTSHATKYAVDAYSQEA